MFSQITQQIGPFRFVGDVVEVEFDDFFEVGEAVLQMGQVFDDALVAVLPIAVFKEDDGAVSGESFLHFEPVIEASVLAAGIGDKDVDGAFGKEELVGGVVDGLAAEVPDVDMIVLVTCCWFLVSGGFGKGKAPCRCRRCCLRVGVRGQWCLAICGPGWFCPRPLRRR